MEDVPRQGASEGCSAPLPSLVYEVEAQLIAQPGVETRNRKRVDVVPSFEHVPPVWELRVGEFRVFYGIDESEREVRVWAVRRKGRKTTGEIV